jgi:hypothetical protein
MWMLRSTQSVRVAPRNNKPDIELENPDSAAVTGLYVGKIKSTLMARFAAYSDIVRGV